MPALGRWAPPLVWAGAIFVASHLPLEVPPEVGRFDWAVHFLIFGVLAAALVWTLSDHGRRRLSAAAVAGVWAGCVIYGISDEWHQSFVPNRVPSALDVAADAAGALVFAALAWWLANRRCDAAAVRR